jgi:hypothetical protein
LIGIEVKISGIGTFFEWDALNAVQILKITQVAQKEYHVQAEEQVLERSH